LLNCVDLGYGSVKLYIERMDSGGRRLVEFYERQGF
jgi:hypothetical protein